MIVTRTALGVAAALAAFALPAAALAGQSAAPQSEHGVAVSDGELRSFAGAVIDLHRIHEELAPRMQGANAQQQEAVRAEAQARMSAAVERHDLDPQTFNRIAAAAEQDSELAQQIGEYVREASISR